MVLVYVVPTSLPSDFSQIGLVIEEKRLIAEAGQKLPKLRESELDSDLQVAPHVSNGDPAYEISSATQELDCDLIVIATHGHTGSRRFWLGSVAEKVVRHAQSRAGTRIYRDRSEHEQVNQLFAASRRCGESFARSITDGFALPLLHR